MFQTVFLTYPTYRLRCVNHFSYHRKDKSTQREREQIPLAKTSHYPHIAQIPDLENQQSSIWKSDKETYNQTYFMC